MADQAYELGSMAGEVAGAMVPTSALDIAITLATAGSGLLLRMWRSKKDYDFKP